MVLAFVAFIHTKTNQIKMASNKSQDRKATHCRQFKLTVVSILTGSPIYF